ncbi:hypothetical protein [Opitutus sp. ER46]|uniref:hypothetical protein n=1 Tax=Opitutus sp. ER46 TaxID=2161864 RepID=UPI000D316B8B|nr:hypothetical protein [Opitutus sp. ER46]PTX98375.1 hypothetical protein DB354_03655 [Opitutus sp. ER46]
MSGPRLIPGGLHRDARGEVRFVNDFGLEGVDRFYAVSPATVGEVRGWVGHLREAKWFFVTRGVIEVGVVRPKVWGQVSANDEIQRFRLDADHPAILEVPPGHYTGSVARTGGAILLVFSTGKMADAKTDDFRMPSVAWEISE